MNCGDKFHLSGYVSTNINAFHNVKMTFMHRSYSDVKEVQVLSIATRSRIKGHKEAGIAKWSLFRRDGSHPLKLQHLAHFCASIEKMDATETIRLRLPLCHQSFVRPYLRPRGNRFGTITHF